MTRPLSQPRSRTQPLAMDNVRIAMVGNGKQLSIPSACSLIVHHFFLTHHNSTLCFSLVVVQPLRSACLGCMSTLLGTWWVIDRRMSIPSTLLSARDSMSRKRFSEKPTALSMGSFDMDLSARRHNLPSFVESHCKADMPQPCCLEDHCFLFFACFQGVYLLRLCLTPLSRYEHGEACFSCRHMGLPIRSVICLFRCV